MFEANSQSHLTLRERSFVGGRALDLAVVTYPNPPPPRASPRQTAVAGNGVASMISAALVIAMGQSNEATIVHAIFSIAVSAGWSKSRNYRQRQLVRGSTGDSALCLRFQSNLHAT
jgi:hypothetical protein